MERQRSFSLKPTRFLVFSCTTCSLLYLLTTGFTTWVIKTTPPIPQQIHPELNKSHNLGFEPINLQALPGIGNDSARNDVKSKSLSNNPCIRLKTSSGFNNISVPKGVESKIEEVEDDGYPNDRNGTSFEKSKVKIRGRKEEKKIKQAGSVQEIEVPRSDGTREKKIIAGSPKQDRGKGCDLTKGSWVYDESYPLYTKGSCSFIDEGFDCQSNGRLDKSYMKWRWQPQGCYFPRFNATKMLELIRGKRLVFVGDSINRNQWESMLCMLMGAVKDSKRVYEIHGRKITKEKGEYSFKFMDYQCTVEYYVTHFLVHESKARLGKKRIPTLRIDTIARGSLRWRGADILVFNTAHWWSHYKTKAGINYYQEGNLVYPKLDVSTAFQKALMTWASWVDKHVNPRKTWVFFRSSAPSHFRGGQWNSGGHCKEAFQPLNETFMRSYSDSKNEIVKEVIKQMKTPVRLLNVTSISEYRIDGHPSIYGKSSEKRKSSAIQDCSHWCLPGVPDAWNELLFFRLQNR